MVYRADTAEDPVVYRRSTGSLLKAIGLCIVAEALAAGAIWAVCSGRVSGATDFFFVFLFVAGALLMPWATWFLSKMRVSVDDARITMHGAKRDVSLQWSEVVRAEVQRLDGAFVATKVHYTLIGRGGERLSFGDDLKGFDELREQVRAFVELPELP